MSNNNNDNNGIVDLRTRVQQREAEEAARKAAEQAKENNEPDPNRVYEVKLKSGDSFQVSGVLMLTGAFFALGMPVGDGSAVDFNWASPVEAVEYVVALDEEDLDDE